MRWSWRLGRVRGVEVRVHATFVLLLAWLALIYYQETGTGAGAVAGIIITIALFASVVLHELGHALMARRFGIATSDITLLPIGGVARLERIPQEPKQELAVTLAGPAVTLVIVLFLYGALRAFSVSTAIPAANNFTSVGGAVAQLMWINLSLLVFNLLPAFPIDGGRVLRAALALRMDHARATEIAARVGRGFALIFGLVGIFFNPWLVLIALFIWLGAAAESSMEQLRTSLAGVSVDQVMIRDAHALSPTDTLGTALQSALSGFQHDFVVVDGDRVVGLLSHQALLAGLANKGSSARVDETMEKAFASAAPNEPLEGAVERLQESRVRTMPVLSGGKLRGLLTLDNISEFVLMASAIRGGKAATAAR